MKIHFLPQFLDDLRNIDDSRFVKRALNHILDEQGVFKKGSNDHRYHGIDNAWIRYISAGSTAYRLIFIQEGTNVYLYRAGQHSIENNLSKPSGYSNSIPVASASVTQHNVDSKYNYMDDGLILRTSENVLLSNLLTSLTHVGHKEIYLVSPVVSLFSLEKFHPFGLFLDKMIEEGTEIHLITIPPNDNEIEFFQTLEERKINVYFHNNLHAKLYVFEINPTTLNSYTKNIADTAIIGSADLADIGLALNGKISNEQLCYRLPISKFIEARDYAVWLVCQSMDFVTYKTKAFRRH